MSNAIAFSKDNFITTLQGELKKESIELSKEALTKIINKAGDIITVGMTNTASKKKAEVHLKMFGGTFKAQYHEAGKAKNPKTGAEVDVPARTQVKFQTPRKDV